MLGSITVRDQKKVFKANGLQSIVAGVSVTGFNTTVRDVGAGKRIAFIGYVLNNNDAAARWLQIFFRPATEVVLGTTAPDMTILVGASGSVAWDWQDPIAQGTGFSVACTTTETGASGPTATMTGSIFYVD